MSSPVIYWVLRVWLHQGRRVQASMLDPGTLDATQKLIDAGAYAMLSDGAICEPLECFADEQAAHTHRSELLAKHPAEDFRVVSVQDVPV